MSDGSVFLYVERALGRGWVGIHIRGLALPKGATQVRLFDWGHKKPYLGLRDWQVAEHWCDVQAVSGESGNLDGVLLSPAITRLLEQGSNYRLSIRVDDVIEFDRPVRWGGFTTNHPGARAPTVVAQASDLPTMPAGKALTPELIGQQNQDSEKKADATAWAAAVADGGKRACETYLLLHPTGDFADAARDALACFLPHQILIRSSFSNARSPIQTYNLDLCVFLLSDQKKVRGDRDFICSYAIEEGTGESLATSICGSVTHIGKISISERNLTSESIIIDLNQIPTDIFSIALTVSLDPRAPSHIGLDSIECAVIEVIDKTTSECLLSFNFKKGQFGVKGNLVAEIIRCGADWKILGRERSFEGGLDDMCVFFGVTTV
jgi:tellurium resistance protein TerD